VGDGDAAMSQEAHGVGTEPIFQRVSYRKIYNKRTLNGETYESHYARVEPGLRREPLPHECACGTVVDRIDEALNVVIDFIFFGHAYD
jgi:hypothetical protein